MNCIVFGRVVTLIFAFAVFFACDDSPTQYTIDYNHYLSELKNINSLEGGACWDIKSAGNGNLYTTTAAGLFRSGDGGNSWEKIETAPPVRNIHILSNGHIVGSTYKTSYFSKDDGNSWELISNDAFTGGEIFDIVEHPLKFLVIATFNGIFSAATIDGKWHFIKSPRLIFDLHIDQDGNVLMAGNSRVLRYFPKTVTLDTLLETGMNYCTLATDDAGNIYAGASTSDTSPTHNVLYISKDNGNSWPEVWTSFDFLTASVHQITIAQEGVIYLSVWGYSRDQYGIFRSLDGAATWQKIYDDDVSALYTSKAHPYTLFAAGNRGIMQTFDQGNTWETSTTGLSGTRIDALTIDAHQKVYLTSGTTILHSADLQNWQEQAIYWDDMRMNSLLVLQSGKIIGSDYSGLYDINLETGVATPLHNGWLTGNILQQKSGRLIATQYDKIQYSDNDGQTWDTLFQTDVRGNTSDLALLDDDRFIGVFTPWDSAKSSILLFSAEGELTGQTDAPGRFWDPQLRIGENESIFILPEYQSNKWHRNIYFSMDLGKTWQNLQTPEAGSENFWPKSFYVNPSGRLIFTAKGGIYFSEDFGRSWPFTLIGENPMTITTWNEFHDGRVLIGTRTRGLYTFRFK